MVVLFLCAATGTENCIIEKETSYHENCMEMAIYIIANLLVT